MKNLKKGFTLIELMIVVAIIAILAAVAAPKFGQQIKKSRDSKAVAVKDSFYSASGVYYTEKEEYAKDILSVTTVMDANATKTAFGDLAGAALSTSGMAMYLPVGTGDTDFTAGPYKDRDSIQVNYTTDGAFSIVTTVNNTNKISWNSF